MAVLMDTHQILGRWLALENGDALRRIRNTSRWLSIAAFVVFVAAILVGRFFQLPTITFVLAGTISGWLIAERNALDARLLQWPIFRQYIDWTRVREDFSAAGTRK